MKSSISSFAPGNIELSIHRGDDDGEPCNHQKEADHDSLTHESLKKILSGTIETSKLIWCGCEEIRELRR